MRRGLIVGESFKDSAAHGPALTKEVQTMQTLVSWLGASDESIREVFDTANAVGRDGLDLPATETDDRPVLVLLGRRAERLVFSRVGRVPRLARVADAIALILPHPSGRNRALNDPAVRRRCERYSRRFWQFFRTKLM